MVDWYSDLSSQDNTAAMEELELQAYQNFDPNRGELAGTNSTGWATEQILGLPFIDKIKEMGVSQSQATASTLELDYPYDYDGDNLYMKVPETGGNTDMYQGFSDEDREKYMDLQDRGSFIDITGGTAGVGEYSMLWIEDAPPESGWDKLLNNPITTTAANTTLKIDFPNGDLRVNDFVRLRNVKSPVGGVPIVTGAAGPALELSTTLDTAATLTDTTITVQTGTHFPTAGFIMIEKVNAVTGLFENEVIQYTGKAGDNFTGCTRATSAPYRGAAPQRTTAGTHPIGAKVFGAYKVDSLNETQVRGTGQPEFTTQFDGVNVTLASNATSAEKGGGLLCTIGPINDRA